MNTDPYYPDQYYRDDHTPEVVEVVEICDGCKRVDKYCNCP